MDGRTWKFINSNLFRPKYNLHNMIMPIYTFGQPVLRKVAEDIDKVIDSITSTGDYKVYIYD